MNLFDMALGGVNSMAAGRVRDLDEEERLARQQALYESRLGARTAAAGPAAPSMDPEATYNFLKQQPGDEDVAADVRASGGQVIKTLEGGVMRDSPAWRESLERLRRLRTMSTPDGDKLVKAESESRQTDTETNILKRAAGGDQDAATGLLASKGQGEFDSLNGGGGTYSKVRGNQSLNAIGASAAAENSAQANKYKADAEKTLQDAKSALDDVNGGGARVERLSTQLNAVTGTVKNLLENKPRSTAGKDEQEWYQSTLAAARQLQAQLLSKMNADPAAAPGSPAQSPKPAAAAKPPKSGQSKGGSTWTQND